jgi:hypothetical protein
MHCRYKQRTYAAALALRSVQITSRKGGKPTLCYTRVHPNVSELSHNEINNNNKHSLRSNTKGYGGKIHWTDSQDSDITAESCIICSSRSRRPVRELFGYTLVYTEMSSYNEPFFEKTHVTRPEFRVK